VSAGGVAARIFSFGIDPARGSTRSLHQDLSPTRLCPARDSFQPGGDFPFAVVLRSTAGYALPRTAACARQIGPLLGGPGAGCPARPPHGLRHLRAAGGSGALGGRQPGGFIPAGVAHGFLAPEAGATLGYQNSTVHAPSHDTGVRWDRFGCIWQVARSMISARDSALPAPNECAATFA
jgi:hypothetical protein